MSRRRQDQLLADLLRRDGWATAGQLADVMGVTPRSIRSYVSAVNARVPSGDAVLSGPAGYRAGPAAHRALDTRTEATPRDRLHRIVRELLHTPDGIRVHETAAQLHVSDATLDADLSRVRSLLEGTELALERERDLVRLRGSEEAERALLSKLVHDEIEAGSLLPSAVPRVLVDSSIPHAAVAPFKTALVRELQELDYFVNELAITDVLLHIVIAADRVASGRALDVESGDDTAPPEVRELGLLVGRLCRAHLGITLGAGDRDHLAALLLTRVVTPDRDTTGVAREGIAPPVLEAVRTTVERASRDYGVDLVDDAFVLRLALHVQNLQRRIAQQSWSRNPLTRSLKTSYPMIFEIAVAMASGLRERLGVGLHDDEIAYIAMHVGGRLERSRAADTALTATIICPGYSEMRELLRASVDRSLGTTIEITRVDTRVDPDWESIDTDLVLSTIDPSRASDRVVRIPPFLTESDVDRIQVAAARRRRARRLARLRDELSRYFSPEAFVVPLPDVGDEEIIRRLAEPLRAADLIDDAYVDRTIARERMSSTAFTEALAVPHALRMTAKRTAISIGVAHGSIAWGPSRVQVVALVAFSENDRGAFQTVFEQLVEVFSEPESAQRIVRAATSFERFLDELVAVIDG